MKLLVAFGLILICCYAQAIETNRYLLPKFANYAERTNVEKFLEKLKTMLRTGNDSLGLPVLDPFIQEHLQFIIKEDIVQLNGNLKDLDVRGLSEYNVNSGDLKIIGMKFTMSLSWPLIYASTEYDMNGTLAEVFNIYGKGDMKISVQGFDFSTELSFALSNNHLKVKSISTNFALKALQFKATGLYNDEEMSDLISAIISEMMPDLIKEYQEDIKGYLHPLIVNAVNDFLSDKTLMDLIKIFG